MTLIAKAAYLWICPKCRRHGRIVCADDSASRDFVTKKWAYEEAARFSMSKQIANDELPELKRQIDVSPLFEEDDELEENLRQYAAEMHIHEAKQAAYHAAFAEELDDDTRPRPTRH